MHGVFGVVAVHRNQLRPVGVATRRACHRRTLRLRYPRYLSAASCDTNRSAFATRSAPASLRNITSPSGTNSGSRTVGLPASARRHHFRAE